MLRNTLCPVCEEARAAREKAEAERLRGLEMKAKWEALCPSDYRKHDPARLPANAPLADVLAWQYGPKGLLAIGPTAAGKTRCMFLLIKRLLEEGRDVRVLNCWSFGHECIRRFREGTGAEWAEALAEVEVCFFDDFGKMPLTERVEAELSGVIEWRTANELPILATSNMTGAGL